MFSLLEGSNYSSELKFILYFQRVDSLTGKQFSSWFDLLQFGQNIHKTRKCSVWTLLMYCDVFINFHWVLEDILVYAVALKASFRLKQFRFGKNNAVQFYWISNADSCDVDTPSDLLCEFTQLLSFIIWITSYYQEINCQWDFLGRSVTRELY